MFVFVSALTNQLLELTHILDCRMGLRQAHDPPGTLAQTSKSAREDPARIGSGEGEIRESREKVDSGYQEERQEWANGRL